MNIFSIADAAAADAMRTYLVKFREASAEIKTMLSEDQKLLPAIERVSMILTCRKIADVTEKMTEELHLMATWLEENQ